VSDTLEHLRQRLAELQRELDEIESLDAPARDRLEAAIGDVDDAIHQREEADHPHSLAERLEDTAGDFEASHPRIASIINGIANVLGQSGI